MARVAKEQRNNTTDIQLRREAALDCVSRDTAYVTERIDDGCVCLLGKRLERHLRHARREGKRARRPIRAGKAERQDPHEEGQQERQERPRETAAPTERG